MPKEKVYSRMLRARVGGKLLQMFDNICVNEELRDGEAIREAIRKYVSYDKENREKHTKENPLFKKP
jgi:metal-responsive CopG/Arc/MetJ family transcriptional regulator